MLHEAIKEIRREIKDKKYGIKEIVDLMKDKMNKDYYVMMRKNQELFDFMLNYKII